MQRSRYTSSILAMVAPLAAGAIALVAAHPDGGRAAERDAFVFNSPAVDPGGALPPRFTADGPDLSPPLAWRHPPKTTRELALTMEDLDRGVEPPWAHWVIYNLRPQRPELPLGLPKEATLDSPIRAAQGMNSWADDNIGYRGPDPPQGDPPHRYRFRLYALNEKLDLPPGLRRDQLLRRIEGHVLATADLVVTYDR